MTFILNIDTYFNICIYSTIIKFILFFLIFLIFLISRCINRNNTDTLQYNFRDKYNILDYFKSEQIVFKHILCLMLLHKTNVSKHYRVRTRLAFPFCLSILSLFKQIITFWVWLSKTYVLSFILWLSTIKLWRFHIKRKPTAFTLSCYCNLSNAFLLFKASRGSSLTSLGLV